MNTREYNRLLKSIKTLPPSAGFTLVEVLVAAVLTMFLIMVAGTGLVKILGSNYKANAASEIRNNMDRTVEFMSDEIRRAEYIADDVDKIDGTAKAAIEASGGKVTLAVRLPEYQDQIIYYTKAAANPWVGPKVLYRYGPPLAANGEFDKTGATQNANGKYNAANWTHSPLIDMLVSENEVPNMDRDCDAYRNNETPDNNRANDPPGWKMLPKDGASTTVSNTLDGFFACVKGPLVMLRLNSKVPLTSKEKLIYHIDTTVYGRSAFLPGKTEDKTSGGSSDTCTLTSCPVTMKGRVMAVHRSDPNCDASKNVCWQNAPVVKKGMVTSEFAVVLDVDQDASTTTAGGGNLEKTLVDVITPTANAAKGNTTSQVVEIYTKETLPNTSDISLQESQILVIVKDITLNKEHHFVITSDSQGNFLPSP